MCTDYTPLSIIFRGGRKVYCSSVKLTELLISSIQVIGYFNLKLRVFYGGIINFRLLFYLLF